MVYSCVTQSVYSYVTRPHTLMTENGSDNDYIANHYLCADSAVVVYYYYCKNYLIADLRKKEGVLNKSGHGCNTIAVIH